MYLWQVVIFRGRKRIMRSAYIFADTEDLALQIAFDNGIRSKCADKICSVDNVLNPEILVTHSI